jgi:hypothetical protein
MPHQTDAWHFTQPLTYLAIGFAGLNLSLPTMLINWLCCQSKHSHGTNVQEEIMSNGFDKISYSYHHEAIVQEEIMSNGFDKISLSGPGVTHLDLAAHGTVSLSRCNINNQAR